MNKSNKQIQENWEIEKQKLKAKAQIKKEKQELLKPFKIPTTKVILWFLFISCTIIEIFTGWVTYKSLMLSEITNIAPDFTPLTTLIGIVVAEVVGFGIYAIKSVKENSSGGIVYEMALTRAEEDNRGE